jgi:hypothetical protein
MKKLGLFTLTFVLLFACTHPAFAMDIGGYLENKLQVTDGQDVTAPNKLKLDFKLKNQTYYLFASLTGYQDFLVSANNKVELSRAYLELYPSWGKAAIGLQNIAWGNGYLFNLPDQFNPVNLIDPKGEKDGINAVSVKWNTSGTSLIEIVAIPVAIPAFSPQDPTSTIAGSDYGFKGLWNIGRFDISVHALKKTIIQSENPLIIYTDRRAGVLELKGELGDALPGVWAQGGWFSDRLSTTGTEITYISSVLGSDYTLPIGNGLYILAESLQNGKLSNNQLYFLTRYSANNYLTFLLSGLWILRSNNALYSLIVKYPLNDNVEFSGMANYYPQGGSSFGLPPCNTEFILSLRTSF